MDISLCPKVNKININKVLYSCAATVFAEQLIDTRFP